jgi:hypothetical protein
LEGKKNRQPKEPAKAHRYRLNTIERKIDWPIHRSQVLFWAQTYITRSHQSKNLNFKIIWWLRNFWWNFSIIYSCFNFAKIKNFQKYFNIFCPNYFTNRSFLESCKKFNPIGPRNTVFLEYEKIYFKWKLIFFFMFKSLDWKYFKVLIVVTIYLTDFQIAPVGSFFKS